jgi:hypothetical protein
MKKNILFLVSSLLIISFSCDSTTEPGIEKSLKGIVKDTQGNLLSDAKVFIIYEFKPELEKKLLKPLDLKFVELTSFYASVFSNGVRLNWSTATELNNLGFEIQKKEINNVYSSIGFVNGNGTTNEPKTYTFTESNVAQGVYSYRLKAIQFDSTFEYSNILNVEVTSPNQTSLEQNYPNPFDKSTTFSYVLRKPSSVTFDISDFNNNPKIPAIWQRDLPAGYHSIIFDLSFLLPSNGYNILMTAKESDGTSFLLKKEFILAYTLSDSSLFTNVANTTSKNGVFDIKYSDIPFGHQYIRTSESDPSPLGILSVTNKIKLVVYKPGYKVVQKDVVINLDEGQEIEITLELE